MELNSKLTKVVFSAEYSRKFPDPLNQSSNGDKLDIEHHILLCRAFLMPADISDAPNPRKQNIELGIYKKEVRESLINTADLSFHLKNKGITIFAHRVDDTDRKNIAVYLGDGDGIADGGHTYRIILKAIEDGVCPEGQFVKIEILTGVPNPSMRADITGGLNTALQVDKSSMLNLKERFEWVKEELSNTTYGQLITYKQNDEGEYDIREILGIMTLFNVAKFPYPAHPKDAYVSKAKCLEYYDKDPKPFQMLRPILKDILTLHDFVHIRSAERWNESKKNEGGKGRAAGMVGVYATKKKVPYEFFFVNEKRDYKLYDGALYPMLGALRFLVHQPNGQENYSWKLGSFNKVKAFFDEIAPELVATTYNTSLTYGRKPNPIGKDDNHWDNLYKTVALHYMTKYS